MTNTLNQIIFFFLHQNQNIFFSNIGNQNIFLEKSHIPSPFKLNGRSLRQNVLVHVFIIRTIRFDYFAKSYKQRLQHDSFVDMLECSCCFSWLYFWMKGISITIFNCRCIGFFYIITINCHKLLHSKQRRIKLTVTSYFIQNRDV